MANIVKDKLVNYEVFLEGKRSLGMADITLPKIEYKTATLSGAGIGGEIEMPTPGQVGSMEIEINWRTINEENAKLLAIRAHDLEFRGANENYDAGTGEIVIQAVKVNVRCLPKTGEIGSLKPAPNTDTKNTMEVLYLKVEVDDKKTIEIDKLNYIHYVDGTDYLAGVRNALGL